jgi:hypothetical protein
MKLKQISETGLLETLRKDEVIRQAEDSNVS